MSEVTTNSSNGTNNAHKKMLINAFDMCTVGHLSPGQWKNPKDKSATKRKLSYWIDLAKLLERGGINALFLADTYGGYDTYEGSLDNCIRRAAQWPMTDPTIVRRNNLKSIFRVLINLANISNGSSDEASQLRHHSINIVRTTISTRQTLQHTGPHDWRSIWLEHRYQLEKSRVQSNWRRYTNRARRKIYASG
jgi:hypothetical protein